MREFLELTSKTLSFTHANKYNFLLSGFGLRNIKTYIYQPIPAQEELTLGGNQIMFRSKLGTPVFSNLILKSKTDETTSLRIDSVIFEVNQQRQIVKTMVQGRNGSIKEYIADGDYMITIRGGIYSDSQQYPLQDVQTLLKLLLEQNELIIESEFLQLFNIHYIVVESYNIPQTEGSQNVQLFEITASSDEPIELEIARTSE